MFICVWRFGSDEFDQMMFVVFVVFVVDCSEKNED